MSTKSSSFLFFILIATSTIAQKNLSPIKPSLIGVHFTLVDYTSPTLIKNTSLKKVLSKGEIFNPAKQSSALSMSYWKGVNANINFSGKLNGIFHNYASYNNPSNVGHDKQLGLEIEGALNFQPITDAHFFTPFITTGIGAGYYANKFGAYVPLGLSWQLNFKNNIYVFLQNQFRVSLSTNIFPDNLLHSLGIAFNITSKQHSGTRDAPIVTLQDMDKDGIVDSLDACPLQPGPKALKGCPDRDGDGIADINDKCPDIEGLAKYFGCPIPDTDSDRINDENDSCPTVPGVRRLHGCPIPDTDKDGLNDEADKCPFEAGPLSNNGCPEVKKEIIEEVNLAAKNIFFKTGSAMLLPASDSSLNKIVQILIENPLFKADIEGHTDVIGSPLKNKILSENRAAAVKTYLISKGINNDRITSKGYGSDEPIADNKTSSGRAQNRRVEVNLRQ